MKMIDKEIVDVVDRFLEANRYDEYKKSIAEFWDEFAVEQPHLMSVIKKEINLYMSLNRGLEDRLDVVDSFLHGLFVLYFTIKKQEEITEMNENWGI